MTHWIVCPGVHEAYAERVLSVGQGRFMVSPGRNGGVVHRDMVLAELDDEASARALVERLNELHLTWAADRDAAKARFWEGAQQAAAEARFQERVRRAAAEAVSGGDLALEAVSGGDLALEAVSGGELAADEDDLVG